jgi:hypothetical protein
MNRFAGCRQAFDADGQGIGHTRLHTDALRPVSMPDPSVPLQRAEFFEKSPTESAFDGLILDLPSTEWALLASFFRLSC